jgi:hypothetical protein
MLPTGTVTFLFTDIEGNRPLWKRDAQAICRSCQRVCQKGGQSSWEAAWLCRRRRGMGIGDYLKKGWQWLAGN